MLGAIVLPIREFCYELIGNAAATGLAIITSIILIGFTAMIATDSSIANTKLDVNMIVSLIIYQV
jgi:hypothetical protein